MSTRSVSECLRGTVITVVASHAGSCTLPASDAPVHVFHRLVVTANGGSDMAARATEFTTIVPRGGTFDLVSAGANGMHAQRVIAIINIVLI